MKTLKLFNLISEIENLKEYLENSYCIVNSAIEIADKNLANCNTCYEDEYNNKYYIETVLFTLDNIKIILKDSILDLNSIDFNTKLNESYQKQRLTKPTAEIIPFQINEDIFIESNLNISKIFERKSKKKLSIVQDNDDCTD